MSFCPQKKGCLPESQNIMAAGNDKRDGRNGSSLGYD